MTNPLFDIQRRRRVIRATVKPRMAILGKPDGTLYCDEIGKYWASWLASKDLNNNATTGQPFKVWAGDTNYVPQAGRRVYVGPGYDGKLRILGAVPDDLVQAELDARAANPNDPYRQFVLTPNIVTFRSDPLANEGEPSLKVNLNQLLYKDAYGRYHLFNGTDENTHLDMAVFEALLSVDEHCYGIVGLKTFDNLPQTVASTPKSAFDPLDLDDVQDADDKLDAEVVASRVYRVYFDQETLIADPVTDWDLRQWVNMPARLGWPTVITRQERVREKHQLLYHGELGVTSGGLEVLGELGVLGDMTDADSGGGSVEETLGNPNPITGEVVLDANRDLFYSGRPVQLLGKFTVLGQGRVA